MTRLVDLPDLVRVEDFAAWAGIGRRQAYAAVARGDVRAVRIGRTLRIPRTALEALLNGDTAAGTNGDGVGELGRADQGARHEPT